MFDIVEFITSLFKKTDKNDTGLKAKERLKLVLISDRATVSPHIMEALREELLEVISRYMTVDATSVEMGLQRTGNAMALAANIPVISMKRNEGRTVRTTSSTMTKVNTAPAVKAEKRSTTTEMLKDKIKPSSSSKKKKPADDIVEDNDDFDENMDSQEIISVSTISEVTDDDDNESDGGEENDKNKSRKRVRRYKTRTTTGRRTSRKKTRV